MYNYYSMAQKCVEIYMTANKPEAKILSIVYVKTNKIFYTDTNDGMIERRIKRIEYRITKKCFYHTAW
jgi:hypothetical protein